MIVVVGKGVWVFVVCGISEEVLVVLDLGLVCNMGDMFVIIGFVDCVDVKDVGVIVCFYMVYKVGDVKYVVLYIGGYVGLMKSEMVDVVFLIFDIEFVVCYVCGMYCYFCLLVSVFGVVFLEFLGLDVDDMVEFFNCI